MSSTVAISNPSAKGISTTRIVLTAMAGTFVEWYDYAIYGYFGLYIAKVFFAASDPQTALLQTFAVYGIAFLARPVGGAIAGHFSDRIGRKSTLTAVIIVTSASTALMGLLPGYASIGGWAPLLLVLCRLVQGLAASGEYAGAGALVIESASPRWRGFLGSVIELASLLGFLAGSGLATAMEFGLGSDAISDWAWRLPFLLALPLGLVGLYMRLKMEDSPAFRQLQQQGQVAHQPVRALFQVPRYRAQLLRLIGISSSGFVAYYTILAFYPAYLSTGAGIPKSLSALASTVTLLWICVLQVGAGAVSDRIGRRRMMMLAQALLVILAIPCFLLMMRGGFANALAGQMILGSVLALVLGAQTASYQELFPTNVRVSGVGVGQGIGAAIFGGTASFIAIWLTGQFGTPLAAAFYMMAIATLSFATWWATAEAQKVLPSQ
jgi:MHS family proline/betaine transporter-like MFS transporter